MSMNFGREQALLRQRLTEQGTPERVSEQQARFGAEIKCLGASDDDARAAAADVVERFPTMGRAQMAAFVRTLWSSKTHDLRAVGTHVLTLRAELLEAPDAPFVVTLLEQAHDDLFCSRLATEVLGTLVSKSKKLWKDLQQLAANEHPRLRLAAVQAAKRPCATDGGVFERFEKLAAPLLASGDEALLDAVDEVLAAAAAKAADAVQAFASEHGRELG